MRGKSVKRLLLLTVLIGCIFIIPTKVKASTENRFVVSDNVCYDPDISMFAFDLSDMGVSGEVLCNVPDGMMTNDPVSFDYSAAVKLSFYKDGEKLEGKKFDTFSEPGSYVVSVAVNSMSYKVMGFTIVDKYISSNSYRLPKGFVVDSLVHNGESLESDPNVAYFDEEGNYLITIVCGQSKPIFDISVTVDRTPPELALSNVVNGEAKGAVSLADAEPGSTLYIEFNNKELPTTELLTQAGSYHVRITDEAGNSSDYYFDIIVAVNANSLIFIIIFVVMVVGIGIYLYVSRRKMRIR